MKTLLKIMGLLVIGALTGWAAETAPPPVMPDEVTLTTGRVLRKVQVIRWEKDRVVLKHSAGADPIAFSLIAEPHKTQILAYKDEMRKPPSERRAARIVTGQVFVTTRGTGSYKFSDAVVMAYPISIYRNMESAAASALPPDYRSSYGASRVLREAEAWHKVMATVTPLAIARTDADGKFELRLQTTEGIFIHCMTTRSMMGDDEINLWAWPVVGDKVNLTSENQWRVP